MILTVGGTKGGTGKSTISTHLAAEACITSDSVLLVDTDETGSSTDFASLRSDLPTSVQFTTVQLRDKRVRTEVLRMRDKYDPIIIDCGARDTIGQRAALSISDVFLVPFAPRNFDMWTLDQVCDLIEEARAFNPELKAYAVINKADPRGKDNTQALEMLQERAEVITALPVPIVYRKAFNTAVETGQTVHEIYASKAAAEMTALYNALNDHCKVTVF